MLVKVIEGKRELYWLAILTRRTLDLDSQGKGSKIQVGKGRGAQVDVAIELAGPWKDPGYGNGIPSNPRLIDGTDDILHLPVGVRSNEVNFPGFSRPELGGSESLGDYRRL